MEDHFVEVWKAPQGHKIDLKKGKGSNYLFDEAVENDNDVVFTDENGNVVKPSNRMAHFFHPDYRRYQQRHDS